MNKSIFIYVLDYCSGGIYEIETEDTEDIESVISKHGLNINCCSWMVSEERKEIEPIEPCDLL